MEVVSAVAAAAENVPCSEEIVAMMGNELDDVQLCTKMIAAGREYQDDKSC